MTPTPWAVDVNGDVSTIRALSTGTFIATVSPQEATSLLSDEDHANVAFIVKAVNCHDELVAACKVALELISVHESKGQGRKKPNRSVIDQLSSALKKVGEL